jgi:hypothetical protein
MKKFSLLMLSLMFAMAIISCEEKKTPETEVDPTDVDNVVTDDPVIDDVEQPDEAVVACKLEDSFFDDKSTEWTAWFTLKMSGLINDGADEDPDFAFLTNIKAKIGGKDYNLGSSYGMYLLDSVSTTDGTTLPAIVAVGVGNLTWPITNKLASLWAGQTFVVVDDLLNWKEQAELEGMTGVVVDGTYSVAIFEIWIELLSQTSQITRMECIRGVSAMNADETAFDGRMFVCVDSNTEWAVGEQMKMMEYSKMVDDETELLAALNEGLEESDPNFRADVCRCWEQDGTTLMDCNDMKIEFGLVEGPDDEPVDEDPITDEEPVNDDDEILATDD